jgi:hypothetical protein
MLYIDDVTLFQTPPPFNNKCILVAGIRTDSSECLHNINTLLFSLAWLSCPCKHAYIVSGDGALYSHGNAVAVIPCVTLVERMLQRIVVQRNRCWVCVLGDSSSNVHSGA